MSEEEIRRYNQAGDFVADTLGVESDISDAEWERLYQLGIDYYYNEGNPLPRQGMLQALDDPEEY